MAQLWCDYSGLEPDAKDSATVAQQGSYGLADLHVTVLLPPQSSYHFIDGAVVRLGPASVVAFGN
jgi:hypothetical protein